MKVDTLYFQGQYKDAQKNADLAKKKKMGYLGDYYCINFWFLYILIFAIGPLTNCYRCYGSINKIYEIIEWFSFKNKSFLIFIPLLY